MLYDTICFIQFLNYLTRLTLTSSHFLTGLGATQNPSWIVASFSLILMTLGPAQGHAAAEDSKIAIVIGNDSYPKPSTLYTCVNDANAIATYLAQVGYRPEDVFLLKNASKDDMQDALRKVVARVQQPNAKYSQVLFYYSGHGVRILDDNLEESDGLDEAFVCIPAPSSNSIDDYMLRDDDFWRYLDTISLHTEQLVVLLDCCFAGGVEPPAKSKSHLRKSVVIAGRTRSKAMCGYELLKILKKQDTEYARKWERAMEAAEKQAVRPSAPRTLEAPIGELRSKQRKASILSIYSSNEYQTSLCGDRYSRFTGALLTRLLNENPSSVPSFDSLEKTLTSDLYECAQSPIVQISGFAPHSPVIPIVFPFSDSSPLQKNLGRQLAKFLTLKKENLRKDVRFDVLPTLSGAIPIGSQFAMDVSSSQAGHFVVLCLGQDESVSVLFPNRFYNDSSIDAGEHKILPRPNGLIALGPPGEETYRCLLFTDIERDESTPFRQELLGKYAPELCLGSVSETCHLLRRLGLVISESELKSWFAGQIDTFEDRAPKTTISVPLNWASTTFSIKTTNRAD